MANNKNTSASLRLRDSALIIMAKEPKVGLTKTRLCPPLTFEDAAKLYEALLRDTIDSVSKLTEIDLAIAITPPESQGFFERISPPGTILLPVICSDIGDCLNQVLNQLLDLGYQKVMALNADGPSLPIEFVYQDFELLVDHNLVFGPSEDGGYYLVGMKEETPEIYTDISWSTSHVLSQTLGRADILGLTVATSPTWYDVDSAADIERLRTELESLPSDRLIHCRRYFNEA